MRGRTWCVFGGILAVVGLGMLLFATAAPSACALSQGGFSIYRVGCMDEVVISRINHPLIYRFTNGDEGRYLFVCEVPSLATGAATFFLDNMVMDSTDFAIQICVVKTDLYENINFPLHDVVSFSSIEAEPYWNPPADFCETVETSTLVKTQITPPSDFERCYPGLDDPPYYLVNITVSIPPSVVRDYAGQNMGVLLKLSPTTGREGYYLVHPYWREWFANLTSGLEVKQASLVQTFPVFQVMGAVLLIAGMGMVGWGATRKW